MLISINSAAGIAMYLHQVVGPYLLLSTGMLVAGSTPWALGANLGRKCCTHPGRLQEMMGIVEQQSRH